MAVKSQTLSAAPSAPAENPAGTPPVLSQEQKPGNTTSVKVSTETPVTTPDWQRHGFTNDRSYQDFLVSHKRLTGQDWKPEGEQQGEETPGDASQESQEGRGEQKPTKAGPKDTSRSDATKRVMEAGLDLEELAQEWDSKGTLTDKQYKDLAAKGITKEDVAQFAEGQLALREKFRNDVAATVGGTEELDAILQWSNETLKATDDDREALDSAVKTGNVKLVGRIIKALQERYVEANGSDPETTVSGEAPSYTGGIKPYGSQDEMAKAMEDPRYKSYDRAYHAQVEKRIEATLAAQQRRGR